MQGYVLIHPVKGVFVAMIDKVPFWSNERPGGITGAIAFPTFETIRTFSLRNFESMAKDLYAHPVQCSLNSYGVLIVTIDECERAGIPRWNPMSGSIVQFIENRDN